MRTLRAIHGLACLCALLAGCADDGKQGSSCSVAESDAGVAITCEDGTQSTIPRGGVTLSDGGVAAATCRVTRDATSATISCSDGSSVSFPVASAMDAGVDGGTGQTCQVTEGAGGSISIRCPDGTQATVPGGQATQSSLQVIGATTASCGTCHDSVPARAHFSVMTVQVDAGPVETCGTCHNETSIEPVSRVHARPELAAPGLKVQLLSASVDPSTRQPTVRVQISETGGALLARDGLSMSFLLSKVESITPASGGAAIAGPYRSYLARTVTQSDTPQFPLGTNPPRMVSLPTAEASTAGAFTAVSSGVYDYRFAYALPADYDANATHVIALYATRTVANVRYVGNAELFFVPANAAATPQTRQIVRNETCNKCHNPLAAHGGSRQDVQLCLTCHTQGAIDPESGNSIDFHVMIHKIHMGKALPSVVAGTPYQIIGNRLSVHDWSHAAFPQAIANCQACHTASDSDRWLTNGTREACVACHENVDKPMAQGGHPFAIQATSTCGNAVCHSPGGNALDAIESHPTSLNLASAAQFSIEIVSVTVANADSAPVVRIRARTGTRATGAVNNVASIDSFSLLDVLINGPNSGFVLNGNTILRIPKAQLVNLAVADVAGEFTFTLPKTLRELVGSLGDPDTDSYTLNLRAQYDPTPGATPDNDRVDMQRNPSAAFGAAETVTARVAIAETDKCNRCHGELSAHGGGNLARNVEQCAMCHTSSLDTRTRQGANKQAGPTTSLRLSTLIHRVHGSAIAETPYKVFGFNAAGAPYPVIDLSELGFPGDARDCTSCHATGTYFLPLPENDPPTRIVSLDADGGVIGQ